MPCITPAFELHSVQLTYQLVSGPCTCM